MTAFCPAGLQEAIFAALQADPDLMARLTGLFDEPVADAVCPYLTMGDTGIAANDVKDRDGATLNIELALWSAEASQMEAKELMAEVDRVMQDASLIVPGYDVIGLRLDSAGTYRQYTDSGSRYRGRLQYRVQVFRAA